MDKESKVMQITDQYLERFGKVMIGIYYLPPLENNWNFSIFINSLLITLRRMDLMPEYSWFMDASSGHHLILWGNGYFRHDLSEITPTVSRLWQIHTQTPFACFLQIRYNCQNPMCCSALSERFSPSSFE